MLKRGSQFDWGAIFQARITNSPHSKMFLIPSNVFFWSTYARILSGGADAKLKIKFRWPYDLVLFDSDLVLGQEKSDLGHFGPACRFRESDLVLT